MIDVPHYFLYGETTQSNALDYLFIASLEESLPKHNWEIHIMARTSSYRPVKSKQNDPRVRYFEEFQNLLEQHYLEHHSVNQYAEKMGLTTGRLNRMCQRYAGQNAMQVIHGRLISEAKRKLIYVDSSMNEIAYDLGFKDPAYFSRFFTRHCGEPQGKYRARLREDRIMAMADVFAQPYTPGDFSHTEWQARPTGVADP